MIKKNQSAVNKQIHFIKCKQSCEKRETVCILINKWGETGHVA
jgi:hypothetical protein